MMTKLEKLFICGPVSGKREALGSSFGQEQLTCNMRGYVDKVGGCKWEKLCREQCEMDSVLQLDHTNDSVFLFFYSLPVCVSFEMIVCHFLGIFVKIGKTS